VADAVARGIAEVAGLIADVAADFHAVTFARSEIDTHIVVFGVTNVIKVGLGIGHLGVVCDDESGRR
jgi:hypothetical protein